MLRTILDTIFVSQKDPNAPPRLQAYLGSLHAIIAVHIVQIFTNFVLTVWRDDATPPVGVTYFFTLIQGLIVLYGLYLAFCCLKSESLISQPHAVANATNTGDEPSIRNS